MTNGIPFWLRHRHRGLLCSVRERLAWQPWEPMIVHWLSRHEPLPTQRRALNELFPNSTLIQDKKVFDDAEEIWNRVKPKTVAETFTGRTDEVVIVAPLSMIGRLIGLGVQPLWPVMEPTTESYAKAHLDQCVSAPRGRWLRFVKFRRLVGIEMKFEELQ